ncbi:MAG: long-chain acyl-CoA synthetase [Solirubrobacteraceae bacterium]|nr:long-chain acyl-CoA synthetase [Solirubrobacteraceae bacterium]
MTEIQLADGRQVTPAQAIEHALSQPTLCAAFQATIAANADRVALRALGEEREITFADYGARVQSIASGLAAIGVAAGDAVGLMLTNTPEFYLVDTALVHLGAGPFSIYFTNPPEQISPLMHNSGARVVVTEPEYAGRLAAVREQIGVPEQIVVIGDDAGEGDLTLAEVESRPAPDGFDFAASWRAVTPETIGLIIYTSGTTGEPKGVEWSHRALIQNVRNVHTLSPASPHGKVLSYLPMAHLFERWFSHYGQIGLGYTVTTVGNAKRLAEAMAAVSPTRFIGVPRIYEKLAAAIDSMLGGETSRSARDAVRARLGLGDAEWLGSAAAPAREDTLESFAHLGLNVTEIWGMSETAMSLCNPVDRIKIGTVGVPMPGFEAKLLKDGELCVRGPIFSGYRHDPERTREAVDEEGWMHSGDIAAQDKDGYYRIVDRKKEIIINSAGKNIPPAMVEARIKQQSPLIAQAVAIGDRLPYLTALLVLDEEALLHFAQQRGLKGSHEELAQRPEVQAEVQRAMDAANATLARIEQVKRYTILADSWTPGSDELTPSLKVKRRNILSRYSGEIAALYS